ncbi:TorF family putative porin [Acinetobacter kyonggiensis]|uniref:MetA-pathway of phenol degradation n=1 Tax=Acinetobacter kyonggiensis TaxID=595670 RepID=A0A1H3FYJ5_9GAMM|nr:TorF family putative porin [Acinetobacter kyonggiensis]SDX95234.1 conserved hypothetical protein [Acinetobacter kyonggiensis]
MLKKLLVVATLTGLSGAVFADETPALPFGLSFSGTAALTSDYRFRGITQTETDPALQAGFTLAHSSGLYVGLWGSNVNFGSGTPSLELDPSIGYATTLESFSSKPVLDVGVVYYNYPSASDLNWAELYGKLSFKNALAEGDSILTNINYTNDYAGKDENSWNVNATYSVPFGTTGFGGVAALGYTQADEYDFGGGDDHYVDWKAGVTYSFASVSGLTAELAAIGTDIDAITVNERGVETGAVFTLTKAF